MSYSIFEGTMADMTFLEVEEASRAGAVVLFPIAVMEEHGPHMCLGTDTYLAYKCCIKIKERLESVGIRAVIAPPFYWGINHCTGAFTGSFTSSKAVMKNLLVETMLCLHKWDFKSIFPINVHLDFVHIQAILAAVKEVKEVHEINAYMMIPDFALAHYGLSGNEEYIVVNQSNPTNNTMDQELDIHAGGLETSWMMLNYPDLVKLEMAKKLNSSKTTMEDMELWYIGGEKVKEMIPMGYIGNPSIIK